MGDKVVRLGERGWNAKMMTPEDALRDALADLGERGAFERGEKVLILALDDTGEGYDISFIQAGMSMSECIALCSVATDVFKEQMGY